MRKQVYKCDTCGLWARKGIKFLDGGKAICHNCGKEMRLGYKDVEPLPSAKAQQFIVMQAAMVKEVDRRKRKAERAVKQIMKKARS